MNVAGMPGEVNVPSEPRDHLSTHAIAAAELFASVSFPETRYLQAAVPNRKWTVGGRGSSRGRETNPDDCKPS